MDMIAVEPTGDLTLDVRVRGGRVVDVALRSTRRADLTEKLEGTAVTRAITAVPALFTLCSGAHETAVIGACEAALGVETHAMTARARDLRCRLELLDNHAFELCTTWPRLLDREPAMEALVRARRATSAIRRWAFGEPKPAKLGDVAILAASPPAPLVAELRAAIAAVPPAAALADETDLRALASAGSCPAAALMGVVMADEIACFGTAHAPLLSRRPASWFEERLVDPSFSARPTIDGKPAEAGAIARVVDHPAVSYHLARCGRGLLARLTARIADARAAVEAIASITLHLQPSRAAASDPPRTSGHGAHVVDTARGPLAHAIVINEGRIVSWRAVAPTEWTFHPEGVVREALIGVGAHDLARRARMLIAALDPCVPCAVHVHEAARA